ncbi:MAG: hypothetical protein NVSMB47_13040 [Polyangiales bacterium]
MTHETLPPLDGAIRSLLDEASPLDPLPPDAHARLRDRLGSTLGAAAVGAGVASVGVQAKPVLASAWTAKTAWLVSAAFLLGGVVGAGGHALLHRSEAPAAVHTVYVERRVELPAAPPAPSAAAAGSSVVPPPPVAATVTSGQQASHLPSSIAAPTVVKDTGLAAERALLEVARTALSRGDPLAALGSLVEHEKRFPRGQLSEEREALYVQALAQSGRRSEAKLRAERFRSRWPASMLLPVVDSASE